MSQKRPSGEIKPVFRKDAFVGAPGIRSSLVVTLRSYLIFRTTDLRPVMI